MSWGRSETVVKGPIIKIKESFKKEGQQEPGDQKNLQGNQCSRVQGNENSAETLTSQRLQLNAVTSRRTTILFSITAAGNQQLALGIGTSDWS
jgi:hypothetical protein